jgi:hypothetical protein
LKILRELEPIPRVSAKNITLPEKEKQTSSDVIVVENTVVNNLDTIKLSQNNTRNIQTIMNKPFDPKRDTYQLNKQIKKPTMVKAATSTLKTLVGARQTSFTNNNFDTEANTKLMKKINAFMNK